MQLHDHVWIIADCGCEGRELRECDEVAAQEHAIINEFIVAPDSVSVLNEVLRELAATSVEAGSED
jgi:hypothetical protein